MASDLRNGHLTLLYVAPERFNNEGFLADLHQTRIALFAVDEAHCISEWGHNFRPEYLKLAQTAHEIGAERVLARGDARGGSGHLPELWHPCRVRHGNRLPPPEPPPIESPVEPAQWKSLCASHPRALGEPRQQARFLCGLSSPALSQARLSAHPLFGALGEHRFAAVLDWTRTFTTAE